MWQPNENSATIPLQLKNRERGRETHFWKRFDKAVHRSSGASETKCQENQRRPEAFERMKNSNRAQKKGKNKKIKSMLNRSATQDVIQFSKKKIC